MAATHDEPTDPESREPPSNAFVPVSGCWICGILDTVARAAWRGQVGLSLRDWLSVSASGMHHRMYDHQLPPTATTDVTPRTRGRPCGPGV